MPVLSRGKHRNPRKGACFMELASYLAGERWSDHPKCTHPLLASLARDVNDHVDDEARTRLAPMIPDVIGLRGGDARVDAWIAREVALTALPIVSAERQGVAAVGLLRCERVLNHLEGRPRHYVSERTMAALAEAPRAREWARTFAGMGWGRSDSFGKRSAPAIIHCAVAGICESGLDNSDDILVDLLQRVIGHCRDWLQHETRSVGDQQWAEVIRMTRR